MRTIAALQKRMSRAEDLMFEMDDVNPEAEYTEEERRILTATYAHWMRQGNPDIKMSAGASAELSAIFDLLNRDDDDDKVANL
jgi:hypothetical protein